MNDIDFEVISIFFFDYCIDVYIVKEFGMFEVGRICELEKLVGVFSLFGIDVSM